MIASPSTEFQPAGIPNLPIFVKDLGAAELFYAPGYLAVVPASQKSSFLADLARDDGTHETAILGLRQHALHARQAYQAIIEKPYLPVCLTLYLNNFCNLSCTYCYSMPSSRPGPILPFEIILAAARIVAENCKKRSIPMTLVIHGGGEPTLSQTLVDKILDELEQLTTQQGIGLFRYIATNGVMPASRAQWMAQRFDQIGLSCDGPSDIQLLQRPLHSGKNSTPWVERTAQVIHAVQKPLHVRVTLTPSSFDRQEEIALYICEQLHPIEIHVEPVYQADRSADLSLRSHEDAQRCLAGFLKAQKLASRYGIRWTTSGARPAEIHAPYCNCFRDVLNLVPEGPATNCFKDSAAAAIKPEYDFGHFDPVASEFGLEWDKIYAARQFNSVLPKKCQGCFNQYHCTHGCPDCCPKMEWQEVANFRCEFLQGLVASHLVETATRLQALYPSGNQVVGYHIDPRSFY